MKTLATLFLSLNCFIAFNQIKGLENYKCFQNREDDTIIVGLGSFIYRKENPHHREYWSILHESPEAYKLLETEVIRILKLNNLAISNVDTINRDNQTLKERLSLSETIRSKNRAIILQWTIRDSSPDVSTHWYLQFYHETQGKTEFVCLRIYNSYLIERINNESRLASIIK